MFFQFLIEDKSTEILVEHIMEKITGLYPGCVISWNKKSFKGIGHIPKKGNILERKTGMLLNDLPMYLRGFDKAYRDMKNTVLVLVMDNDQREPGQFRKELKELSRNHMILMDHVYCIAVKEMEAWLLGDVKAIEQAYPDMKRAALRDYEQDGICDTWEVLANAIYPGGLAKLKKKAAGAYSEIGKMKQEWADKIGEALHLEENISPSFQYFIKELEQRIEAEQKELKK